MLYIYNVPLPPKYTLFCTIKKQLPYYYDNMYTPPCVLKDILCKLQHKIIGYYKI